MHKSSYLKNVVFLLNFFKMGFIANHLSHTAAQILICVVTADKQKLFFKLTPSFTASFLGHEFYKEQRSAHASKPQKYFT